MDPQKASRTQTFKKFLSYLDDYLLKYQIAKELGFIDVLDDIAKHSPEILIFGNKL